MTDSPPTNPDRTIERMPSVLRRTGLSRSSLYLLITRGSFPRPVHLTTRLRGFVVAEIDEWVAAKAKERPNCIN